MPKELCEAFVSRGESNRKRVMGDLRHFCVWIWSLRIQIINGRGLLLCLFNRDVILPTSRGLG
ncbi:hypothetical protein N7536_011696, partial [Penicillium majusculum]